MLYVVPTPIGNLGDITLRALDVLKAVDLIACEDTRHSLRLLKHYNIAKPLISFHEHNEAMRTAELREKLRHGANIALISDAGIPGVSDPGRRLVAACIEHGIDYTVLPGASSVMTALVGSATDGDEFHFGGFLPTKSGQRERAVQTACERDEATVFFESPHRLLKTLEVLARLSPGRKVCVARELSKQFEEFRIGIPSEIAAHYSGHPIKGEIVLVILALTKQERRSR